VTYQSPGVYIEEVPSGPQPIAAASTSVVAVLGTTRKGPVKKPTRVTSWSDFVRTFGPATSRSFTAESVFGFFENGGPAAYIVRVDPSAPASWQVADAAGNPSFTVTASSGGSWANDVVVAVGADLDGPKGTFFRGELTGASTGADGAYTLPLASTVGLRAGDTVTAVPPVGAAAPAAAPSAVTGTVTSVSPTSIVADFSGTVNLPAGSVVASGAPNATTVHVSTARGFKVGEVVTIVAPNGARTAAAVVTAAEELGTGMVLTLDAAAGAVAGAGLVQRRVTIPVTVGATSVAGTPPASSVGVAALTFPGRAPAPTNAQLNADGPRRAAARFTTGDGRRATFASNTFSIPGSAAVPANGGTVEMGVFAYPYVDNGLSLSEFGSADLVDAYGWVPNGTVITLSGSGVTAITATRTGSTVPANAFTLSAAPGADDVYTTAAVELPAGNATSLIVRANAAPRVGDALRLADDYAVLTDVESKGGDAYILRWTTARPVAAFTGPTGIFAVAGASVEAERFAITVTPGPGATERFAGLSLSSAHPNYYAKPGVINDSSAYITVSADGPDPSTANLPAYATQTTLGSDVPAASADYVDALKALEAETEPAMVIAPDAVRFEDPLLQADLIGKVITHCEQFRRFAIIDAPDEDNDQDLANWRNATVSSTYASVFAPHLSIVTIDPDSIDRYTTVPPSGFVAGVFARTDRERGVHKAPGNERVSGIVGLSENYTQRRQDLLNPTGVNLIRSFPGRGTRIWGARNATDDVTWRYINVRRLFNMIETSVDRSTQWVVFEPNTASTWIRIKVSVENFLDQQWRAGALAGTKPEEAYRVRVGLGSTMTETDIDLGLVITEVAIAPAKPAEFVVFRFSHKRLSE